MTTKTPRVPKSTRSPRGSLDAKVHRLKQELRAVYRGFGREISEEYLREKLEDAWRKLQDRWILEGLCEVAGVRKDLVGLEPFGPPGSPMAQVLGFGIPGGESDECPDEDDEEDEEDDDE